MRDANEKQKKTSNQKVNVSHSNYYLYWYEAQLFCFTTSAWFVFHRTALMTVKAVR